MTAPYLGMNGINCFGNFGNLSGLGYPQAPAPIEPIPVVDDTQFNRIQPKNSGPLRIDFTAQNTDIQRFAYELNQARLSGQNTQILFEKNVGRLDMAGSTATSLNQAQVNGNVQSLSQMGQNGAKHAATVLGDLEKSYQSGRNSRNQLIVRKRLQNAILDGEGGTENQLSAKSIDRLTLAGASHRNDDKPALKNDRDMEGFLQGIPSVRHDVMVNGNTKQVLTTAYKAESKTQISGNLESWEDSAEKAQSKFYINGNIGSVALNGLKNTNHLNASGFIQELGLGEKADGNTNYITAEKGLQRFGLIGKNNNSTIFSHAGDKQTEATLAGQNNQTLYSGSGKQTIRIGGEGNQSTVVTSDLTSQIDLSKADRPAFEATQTDTLDLGGKKNEVIADLGVGNDEVFVQASSKNANSNFIVSGGAGSDTMTLEGREADWDIRENKEEGTKTYIHKEFNQSITVSDIEEVKYTDAEKLDSSQIGFHAPVGNKDWTGGIPANIN
jgi:hypothetical protein